MSLETCLSAIPEFDITPSQVAIQPYAQADENGVIEIDGKRYLSLRTMVQLVNTGHPKLHGYFKKQLIMPIEGYDIAGRLCYFYPEEALHEYERDFGRRYFFGQEGLIEVNNEDYCTAEVAAELSGLAVDELKNLLTSTYRFRRVSDRPLESFYRLNDIASQLKDYLEKRLFGDYIPPQNQSFSAFQDSLPTFFIRKSPASLELEGKKVRAIPPSEKRLLYNLVSKLGIPPLEKHQVMVFDDKTGAVIVLNPLLLTKEILEPASPTLSIPDHQHPLYIENQRFVFTIAKMFMDPHNQDFENLLQTCREAMLLSIPTYDPEQGTFINYAKNRMIWASKKFLEQSAPLIRNYSKLQNQLNHLKPFLSKFQLLHGRYPESAEVASHFHLSIKDAEQLILEAQKRIFLPFDALISKDDEGFALSEILPDTSVQHPGVHMDFQRIISSVREVIQNRFPKNADWFIDIFFSRVGVDLNGDPTPVATFNELGKKYGVSREWIRLMEVKMFKAVRSHFSDLLI